MKLFYKLFIEDSRQMKDIPSESVDYIVTSPPYWFLEVFSTEKQDVLKGDLSRIPDKKTFFIELSRVFKECERVLKQGGHLTVEWEDIPIGSRIVGYPRQFCITGDMVDSVEKTGLYLWNQNIWKKFEAGAATAKFQYLLYPNLGTNDVRSCMNWAYVFTWKKREFTRQFQIVDFTREEWQVWADGVWRIENPSDEAAGLVGGAVFPVELIMRLIRMYTKKGSVVLDPFLGTGTTMKSAFITGRSCMGYEVNPRMKDIIKNKVGWGAQRLGEDIKWQEK